MGARRLELGIDTGEKGAQSGEAGTDNGHVRLDLRPHVSFDYGVCTDVR